MSRNCAGPAVQSEDSLTYGSTPMARSTRLRISWMEGDTAPPVNPPPDRASPARSSVPGGKPSIRRPQLAGSASSRLTSSARLRFSPPAVAGGCRPVRRAAAFGATAVAARPRAWKSAAAGPGPASGGCQRCPRTSGEVGMGALRGVESAVAGESSGISRLPRRGRFGSCTTLLPEEPARVKGRPTPAVGRLWTIGRRGEVR